MTLTPDRLRVEIVRYEDRLAAEFKRLNIEWLESFGLLAPHDLDDLDAPREAIVAPGGQIFFAVEAGVVIGTCAVRPVSPTVAELAKLAVTPAAQGRGIGRRLVTAAVEHARSLAAEKLVLVSNSRLTSAIRLYETLGFEHGPVPADSGYATADVYMELSLMPRPC